MTQERKNELYDKMLTWICEHIQNDEDLFLTPVSYTHLTLPTTSRV